MTAEQAIELMRAAQAKASVSRLPVGQILDEIVGMRRDRTGRKVAPVAGAVGHGTAGYGIVDDVQESVNHDDDPCWRYVLRPPRSDDEILAIARNMAAGWASVGSDIAAGDSRYRERWAAARATLTSAGLL